MNIKYTEEAKEKLLKRYGNQVSIIITTTPTGCHRFKEDVDVQQGVTSDCQTSMIIDDEIIFHIDQNIMTRTDTLELYFNSYDVLIISGINLI